MAVDINGALLGVIVTVMIALLSLSAWVGALSQKVKRNEQEIADNRKNNREDHQLIFDKLEEINRFIRNGQRR